MFKLLKGGRCFIPEDVGKKDILVVYDKIGRIEDNISLEGLWDVEVINCGGKIVSPGFIDQHVHITGGGGEAGPASRIPELMPGEIALGGVSTVVGLLGADGITRSMEALLAKARALQAEGITAYIYTGSYTLPVPTLTGRVMSDMVLIDRVIGAGEIAISDHRSSHPSLQQLKELASEVHVGGLLGEKAGVMHIHVGDGKEGLKPLVELVEGSDFPPDMFVPTHVNRNGLLLQQAAEYAKKGGNIDLTAGDAQGQAYSVADAVRALLKSGAGMERVTVSSDGNGSIPPVNGGDPGIGRVRQLFEDVRGCVLNRQLDMETAIKMVTANVAKVLKLYPQKGALQNGSDADILILDDATLEIDTMLIRGQIFIYHGKLIKKGRYED